MMSDFDDAEDIDDARISRSVMTSATVLFLIDVMNVPRSLSEIMSLFPQQPH